MSIRELYPDLLCASSNDHIVKEPITLDCSHGVCKTCIPKNNNKLNWKIRWKIECKICGTNQQITKNENILMNKLIGMSLSGLFDALKKQMSEEIRKYKGTTR